MLLGPFLRSATDSDFPKPVRFVRRQRLAATLFARSKPVNWVRILPKMFLFLRGKGKLMFYICWFVHNHWFLNVGNHVCSWSSLTKYVENAAARSRSWFKWEVRGGVVSWWKICWHIFLKANSGKFLFENLAPFEKFRCCGKEEARPGGCIMNMRRKKFSHKPYRLHQSCLW